MNNTRLWRAATGVALAIAAASATARESTAPPASPVPAAEADGAAGVRRIPITTALGTFEVWTRTVGASDTLRLLLLHGGPGVSHGYLEPLARLAEAGFEVVFYDQLGCGSSDRPEGGAEAGLWANARYVDEIEQVRRALGIAPEQLVLYGHSWGGALAIDYALAHPGRLAGLVVSNMAPSVAAINAYTQKSLLPAMDQDALAELRRLEAAGEWQNPRRFELLLGLYFEPYFVGLPAAEWPPAVQRAFATVNPEIQLWAHGPSELELSGAVAGWDRTADLGRVAVPTLVLGGGHDTVDPADLRRMAEQLPRGRYHHSPEGGHLPMWDDPEAYFAGLLSFLEELAAGRS